MEQSANEGEECGICLDVLTNPVELPCSHKFCCKCLNGWRSKYGVKSEDKEANTKCPMCREKIPPTKEMICQLKSWRNAKSEYEAKGDVFSEEYMLAKSRVERLEREIGDWTETIDYADDDDNKLILPETICEAASENEIQKVLDWLGPLPVAKQQINAKNPDFMDLTLMHFAAMSATSDFLSILLQLGADVDPVDANGFTPLGVLASLSDCYTQERLLLEWGAEISNCPYYTSNDEFIELALKYGNSKMANLMKSEFGGRRCEIINLQNHPDLIGKTCVVEKYLPTKGRYKVVFETKEVGLVGPENLKRRDRTPDDCGYYVTYKNGRYTRHEFASKEECQAFVASLTDEEKTGDGDTVSEARAEQAAKALLAELTIDSSGGAKSDTKCEQEGKNPDRK